MELEHVVVHYTSEFDNICIIYYIQIPITGSKFNKNEQKINGAYDNLETFLSLLTLV